MKKTSNGSEELCKSCGLCCEGFFHSNATIYNDKDMYRAKDIKANISCSKDGEYQFSLPCPAFDTICTVYSERPSVCSNHKCDLLLAYERDKISFDKAVNIITKMRNTLKELIPELQEVTNNYSCNDSTYLRKTILEFFPDKVMNKEFKIKHKKMLMNYALFIFLKETYFYKPNKMK